MQRALKLKARREARLKAVQTTLAAKDAPLASDQASNSSFSTYSSPVRTKLAELPQAPPALSTHNTESEIDFSPSVGGVPLHPVPSSSNGGATLDWTGSASEDERDKRWSLSISKRKHRDKTAFFATRSIVEKQEGLYVGAWHAFLSDVMISHPRTSRQDCEDQGESQASHLEKSLHHRGATAAAV